MSKMLKQCSSVCRLQSMINEKSHVTSQRISVILSQTSEPVLVIMYYLLTNHLHK